MRELFGSAVANCLAYRPELSRGSEFADVLRGLAAHGAVGSPLCDDARS